MAFVMHDAYGTPGQLRHEADNSGNELVGDECEGRTLQGAWHIESGVVSARHRAVLTHSLRLCPPGSHPPNISIDFHLVNSGSMPSPGAGNVCSIPSRSSCTHPTVAIGRLSSTATPPPMAPGPDIIQASDTLTHDVFRQAIE